VAKWIGLYLVANLIGGLVELATHQPTVGSLVGAGAMIAFIAYAAVQRRVRREIESRP
jgi:hypothetical protein